MGYVSLQEGNGWLMFMVNRDGIIVSGRVFFWDPEKVAYYTLRMGGVLGCPRKLGSKVIGSVG